MAKLSQISGFPEWLPEQRIFEEQLIDRLKAMFRGRGFVPIETAAAEFLSTLEAKGVAGKEIYTLRRIHEEGDEEASLALHFDLTVPFARYVAQNLQHLSFPFKRYQVQKVWRGERPQRGRAREFCQCDFDIIARDELPISCDAEILEIIDNAFQILQFGKYEIRINNRKLLTGLYTGLGLTATQSSGAITIVDKIDKIGPEMVRSELQSTLNIGVEVAKNIVTFAGVRGRGDDLQALFEALPKDGSPDGLELRRKGEAEISDVLSLVPVECRSRVTCDLSLARGLEYYTGAILEVRFPQFPQYGSVTGGGRYENLASEFTSQKLPGVGASLGITRLMELAIEQKLLSKPKSSGVLVTVLEEGHRPYANAIAARVRQAGIVAEVFFKSPKLGKQIEYAEKKGYRHVIFGAPDKSTIAVKDIVEKTQRDEVLLESWLNDHERN